MALTIIIFTVGKSSKPFCINEFKPFEFGNITEAFFSIQCYIAD